MKSGFANLSIHPILERIIDSTKEVTKQELLRLGLIAFAFLLVIIAMFFVFVLLSQKTLYDGKVLIVGIIALLLGASFIVSATLSE